MTRGDAAAVAIAAIALAAACAAFPLYLYVGTLAAFGLAHVMAELRYVDQRFSARIPRRTLVAVLGVLGAIVLMRVAALAAGAPSSLPLRELELLAVAALAAIAAAHCAGRGGVFGASVAATAVVLLFAGTVAAPASTLVVLAVLHNLTPVGFLAERLRGAARRRALALCVVVFAAVPAAIASGVGMDALESFGLSQPDASPLAAGPLEAHLGVFVPMRWLDGPFAHRLFAAAAYLQCAHYVAVLWVLPRLGAGDAAQGASVARWPRGALFAAGVGILAVAAFVGFSRGFVDARRAYGVVAAFHAWSEVPVLLLAAAGSAGLRAPTRTGGVFA